MIVFQSKREKNFLNIISLLMAPYVVLVFINNFFLYKNGFYKVDDKVLCMILSYFISFFIGSVLVTLTGMPLINENDNKMRLEKYNLKWMRIVVLFIGVLALLKVVRLFLAGQFSVTGFNDAEGVVGNGPIGHLLLFSYSLVPILFLDWIENKKNIWSLIAVISIVIPTFFTFIKYNVIGLIVNIFIFLVLYKRSILIKAVTTLIAVVVAAFVLNYLIGFVLQGITVQNSFYFNHLWVYCAGSIIYDRYIFMQGINTNLSIGYKLLTYLFALPNMFINKITGGTIFFPYVNKPNLAVGTQLGQESNVTDGIGDLFPSHGDAFEIVLFVVVAFTIGILFTSIYIRYKNKTDKFNPFLSCFMTFFVFFQFYGTFYINSGPWEIIVYSLFASNLFLKKGGLSEGKITIG